MGTLLFYAGIAGMVLAAAGGVTAAAILRASRRKLNARLEEEFGKKRR